MFVLGPIVDAVDGAVSRLLVEDQRPGLGSIRVVIGKGDVGPESFYGTRIISRIVADDSREGLLHAIILGYNVAVRCLEHESGGSDYLSGMGSKGGWTSKVSTEAVLAATTLDICGLVQYRVSRTWCRALSSRSLQSKLQ